MKSIKITNTIKFVQLTVVAALLLTACGAPAAAAVATPTTVAVTQGGTVTEVMPVGSVTKLDLNTATADQFLAAIPGLPSRMTREFDEYRPYVSIQQFRQEIGKYVDAATVAEYEKYVYVPISINNADTETLQQIPGLDVTEAESLMAARPFASNDAFLAALAAYVSGDELTSAQTYLAAS